MKIGNGRRRKNDVVVISTGLSFLKCIKRYKNEGPEVVVSYFSSYGLGCMVSCVWYFLMIPVFRGSGEGMEGWEVSVLKGRSFFRLMLLTKIRNSLSY